MGFLDSLGSAVGDIGSGVGNLIQTPANIVNGVETSISSITSMIPLILIGGVALIAFSTHQVGQLGGQIIQQAPAIIHEAAPLAPYIAQAIK
jgi:phage-related protein